MQREKTKQYRPAALIFDMDGVIVDNSKYHNSAWIEFCRRRGKTITAADVEVRFGNTNAEYLRHIFDTDFTKEDLFRYGEEKEAIYREMYAPELRPAPGLINLLRTAAERGIPCAVATAAPTSNVEFVIDGTDVRKYFRLIVDSEQVTKGKPDPEIYLVSAARLQVAPEDCVVFEDSVFGIRSGKSAGMKVVALTSTYPAEKIKSETSPDLIIDDFDNLELETMEQLFRN